MLTSADIVAWISVRFKRKRGRGLICHAISKNVRPNGRAVYERRMRDPMAFLPVWAGKGKEGILLPPKGREAVGDGL
jgi:hypothetical protein